MRRIAILLVFTFASSGCWGDERTIAIEDRALDAADLDSLLIDVDAGDLDVVGDPGLEAIQVRVRLRTNRAIGADDDGAFERMEILLEARDAEGVLRVSLDDVPSGYSADVVAALPERMLVRATDDSGDVRISGVSTLELSDSSGDVVVEDIANSVLIDDDSGDIDVARVGGDVEINDGSGEIFVREVGGVVRIRDGSGDIDVAQVGGFELLEDGSGDVRF